MEVNSRLPIKSNFHTPHFFDEIFQAAKRENVSPLQVIEVNHKAQPDQAAKGSQDCVTCQTTPMEELVQIDGGGEWKPSGLVSCDGKEDNGKVDIDPAPGA